MINAPLLKQTLAQIEANPGEWDQTWCRCGTGMCFAGWAAHLAGGQWYSDDPDTSLGGALIAEPDESRTFWAGDGVQVIYADNRAQVALGLDDEQANELFSGGNKLPDLRRIVARLCGEAA